MNEKEILSVLNLSKEKLYKTFLLRVSDYNKIWILYDDGVFLYGDEHQNTIFPIWPEKEFAELCISDEWANATPVDIDLEEFLNEYIPDLIENKYLLSIFPRPNTNQTIVLEPQEFAKHITSYILDNYGELIQLSYL